MSGTAILATVALICASLLVVSFAIRLVLVLVMFRSVKRDYDEARGRLADFGRGRW